MPWLLAAWQQEAPSDVIRESCSSPGKAKPCNARYCLSVTAGGLSRVFSDGSSVLEHLNRSRQVRTGQPFPCHSFQCRMNELSFELLNYIFPSWPRNRSGWKRGRRKSCSVNKILVGVWCVGAADLPNPAGFTPPSWAQLGNLAGFGCLVPGKAWYPQPTHN